MEIGFLVIGSIVFIGGIIAFIGDKLGSKVGKKRLSLFNMRPKHTSILVTIITGVFISAATLCIMLVLSENVRIALFGMKKLQTNMEYLVNEINSKNLELNNSKIEIDEKTKKINIFNKEIDEKSKELSIAEYARKNVEGQLFVLNGAYNKASLNLKIANEDLLKLENTKKSLENNIQELERTTENLKIGIENIRKGDILFKVGEDLYKEVLPKKLNKEDSERALINIISEVNNQIADILGVTDEDTDLIYIKKGEFEEVIEKIKDSDNNLVIRILAANNIVAGEPAPIRIEYFENKKIFTKGSIIYKEIFNLAKIENPDLEVISFLQKLNKIARSKGVLTDPITGQLGSLEAYNLFAIVEHMKNKKNSVEIIAIASEDVYTQGPLLIELKIKDKF